MDDVQIFEQEIINEGKCVGKIVILVGGLNQDNPKEFMDGVVNRYVRNESHNQFVEIHLDNPWTRVITNGINQIPLRPMLENDHLARKNEV